MKPIKTGIDDGHQLSNFLTTWQLVMRGPAAELAHQCRALGIESGLSKARFDDRDETGGGTQSG